MHNENTISELADFVFLDPQWLTNVMSSVVTLRHNLVKLGQLRHCDLTLIWKPPMFPPSIHHILIKLLTKFDIIYPLPVSGTMSSGVLITDGGGGGKEKESEHTDNNKNGHSSPITITTPTTTSQPSTPLGTPTAPSPLEMDTRVSLVPCLLSKERPFKMKNVWPHFEHEFDQISRIWEFRFLPLGVFSRLFVRVMTLVEKTNAKRTDRTLDVVCYWYAMRE